MHSKEFVELVGRRNILSSEEKLSIYYYLSTGTSVDQLLFDSQKRNQSCWIGEELWVNWVAECGHGGWNGNTDAIDFSTNET